MGLFNSKIKRPNLMKVNDDKRYEFIEKWWSIKPEERLSLVSSVLDNSNISYPTITNLADHKSTKPHIIKAYNLEDDIKNGDLADLEMYSESMEDPSISMLLELLIPEKKVTIPSEPFAEIVDLSEVVYIYPEIWINMLNLIGIKLNYDSFNIKIDGKKPDLKASPKFKKIIIEFNYNNKTYSYKYKRHWVYSDVIDFDIIKDVEKFYANNNIDNFLMKAEGGEFDANYFLLPSAAIEEFDKYIDHIG